jgi:hypothetical protein
MSEEKQKNSTKPSPTTKPSQGATLIGIFVFLFVCIVGSIGVPTLFGTFFFVNTKPVPGDAANFDLIAGMPEIYEWIGADAELKDLYATGVRSDGTMDLFANYTSIVSLTFVRPTQANNDLPLGAGGSESDIAYEEVDVDIFTPNQMRTSSSSSNGMRTRFSYINRGALIEVDGTTNTKPITLFMPTCSFADLWAIAIENDVPENAVAAISYDNYGYDFRIIDTNYDLEFSQDCELLK